MSDPYEYGVTVWPRSELRELPSQEPVKANWHTFAGTSQVIHLDQVHESVRYYVNRRRVLVVVQQWHDGQVVWDSRHARPEKLTINGAAYRSRTRRRRP